MKIGGVCPYALASRGMKQGIGKQKESLDRCSMLLLFCDDQELFAAFALFTGSLDPFAPCVRGADHQAIGNSVIGRLWISSKVHLHP